MQVVGTTTLLTKPTIPQWRSGQLINFHGSTSTEGLSKPMTEWLSFYQYLLRHSTNQQIDRDKNPRDNLKLAISLSFTFGITGQDFLENDTNASYFQQIGQ